MSTDAATIERIDIQVKSQQSVCEHYCGGTTIAVCLERHVLKCRRRSGIHNIAGTEPKHNLLSYYTRSTIIAKLALKCGSTVDSARLSSILFRTRLFVRVHHALCVSAGHTCGTVHMGTIVAPRAMPTESIAV